MILKFLKGLKFPIQKIRTATGMTLKFYTSAAKVLKLKVRKFCRLSLTFVEVTEKKLVGEGSLLLLNSIGLYYVLIKNFNRYLTKIKYHGKKHFCQCYLQCFSIPRECHIKKLSSN